MEVMKYCCPEVLTHTVVTDGAVGGSWGPEDLAGEAVLLFDCNTIDSDLFGAGWRPQARTIT